VDNKNTVIFLIEGDGFKGRRVIDILCRKTNFNNTYDIKVILDENGKAVDTIEEYDLDYIITNSPTNPVDAIQNIISEDDIDFLVSCGWGYKIPKYIIEKTNYGSVNCHSSYLPDYKGLAVYRPIWAHAEKYGGATIHYLSEKFDEGNIITQRKFEIGLFDTPLGIAKKYSKLTAKLLPKALRKVKDGYKGEPNENGRYYSKISWTRTLLHGIINHLLRAIGIKWRWEIDYSK